MRLLYISHSNANDGSNIALLNLIKGMISHGHDVAVITTAVDGPMVDELDSLGIEYDMTNTCMTIYPINKNPFLYIPRLIYLLYRQYIGQRAVIRMIKSFKPDIVHTNVGPLGIGYEACKKTGVPHVWHQREFMDMIGIHFFPSFASFRKKSHAESNYNICVTNGVFNHWKFDRKKDTVIYDGVFAKGLRNHLPERKPEKKILFIGRIEFAKGLMDLLETFAIFCSRHPEYELEVIGDTQKDSIPYKKKCLRYVHDKGLEHKVHILGRKENIYTYMAKAKMLVMPSFFEGFGFVTAEAMACGCPVIGRATAGIREQMENGLKLTGNDVGFMFSNNEEMLEAMEKVLSTDTSDMCASAKKTVFDLYTTERNVGNIEKYYNTILSNRF